jgi:hypothetical protein
VCAKLGFTFEYGGYQITAATLERTAASEHALQQETEQLQKAFDGQINLTDQTGTVSITIKRPSGRAEVAFDLREPSRSGNKR